MLGSCKDLIGAPFRWGARGPDAYDCFGLLREAYKRVNGIEIPDDFNECQTIEIASALLGNGLVTTAWVEVEEGTCRGVLIRVKRYAAHVGFILPDGRLLHTWEDSGGACCENLDHWRRRIIGYYDYRPGHSD